MVNVPDSVVFSFITDPANLPRLLRGNLASVSDIVPLPNGGYRYRWTYSFAGFPIRAEAEMTEVTPYSRIIVESSGGLRTISTWVFEPQPDGATSADFSIEAPDVNFLLRRLSGGFIRNQLRFAVEVALQNVKYMAEQHLRSQQTAAPQPGDSAS